MSDELIHLLQLFFYIVSPIVSFSAVFIAYLAMSKQSQPNILVYYRPNVDEQSKIDLVIENTGSSAATELKFSEKLPIGYWGIDKSDGSGDDILTEGLPVLASGQKYIFDGGQFGGLKEKLRDGLKLSVSYKYKNPFGIIRNKSSDIVLAVDHLKHLPTKFSANRAIVKALIGKAETTTLNLIEKHLSSIAKTINQK